VAESNTGAIALYERLGFTTRKPVTFRGFRTP
jgi:ribosomal protein S18 acetylase RimI-like enzyme